MHVLGRWGAAPLLAQRTCRPLSCSLRPPVGVRPRVVAALSAQRPPPLSQMQPLISPSIQSVCHIVCACVCYVCAAAVVGATGCDVFMFVVEWFYERWTD